MLKYTMYDGEDVIGFFCVEERLDKDIFTVTLIKPNHEFAYILGENSGEIDESSMSDWIYERIVPPTRQNIDQLLVKMGLQDYDQLDILKFTKGRSVHDDIWIDFSKSC